MIKKNLAYIVLMMILMVAKPSFSMHQLIFRGAKLIGKGTLPVLGGAVSYYQTKKYKKFSDDIDRAGDDYAAIADVINNQPFTFAFGLRVSDERPSVKVEQFLKKRMEKCDDSSARLSIVMAPLSAPAAVIGSKVLCIDANQVEILDSALKNMDGDSDKVIAKYKMFVGHEMSHVINNDAQNRLYVLGLMPLATEVMGARMTQAFYKKWNVKLPNTWLKTAFRSSIAVGSIMPKLFFNLGAMSFYQMYHETCADKFACENAETRQELEAFYSFSKDLQRHVEEKYQSAENTNEFVKKIMLRFNAFRNDPVHLYPSDRADMVQKYIDKWDAEHKET